MDFVLLGYRHARDSCELINLWPSSMIELEFRNVDFLRREENRRTLRKTLEARERINNKLNSHEVPHWDHSGERRENYRNTTHAPLIPKHFLRWHLHVYGIPQKPWYYQQIFSL
jgi:hypothetical protein